MKYEVRQLERYNGIWIWGEQKISGHRSVNAAFKSLQWVKKYYPTIKVNVVEK